MKTLIFILMVTELNAYKEKVLFDFNSLETTGRWYIVNDVVMGGVSGSKLRLNKDGNATFSGNLSPENNGGFASMRSRVENITESQFSGVIVRIKGDGNIYSLRFRTELNFDGYAYQAKLQTKGKAWEEFKIPFEDFKPTFRGRTLSNKPKLVSKDIAQIGLLIADKQFGDFTVDIDWIKFYK